jgi:starch synthase
MEKLDAPAITGAIDHALKLYTDIRTWKRLVQTAMAQDYSWSRSAEQYLALYTRALNPAG